MGGKRETFARVGIATKGIVYCIVGVLTALTAFRSGGEKMGSSGVIDFLAGQTYGIVLLVLVSIGLAGFVFWRLYQVFDTKEKSNDLKAIGKKVAYFISAVFYAFLLYTAISAILGSSNNASGGQWYDNLLNGETGVIILSLIGVGFLIKAFHQFYVAYSGKYTSKVNAASLRSEVKRGLITLGKVGFTARGVVVSVIAFLTFKELFSAGQQQSVEGKKEAFQFLHHTFGMYIFGVIALGLLAYGVFMIVLSRYKKINLS